MRQWGKILQNLSGRSAEKLIANQDTIENSLDLIIGASNDWGVARNGGRIGARFAPEAIINIFSKMSIAAGHCSKWHCWQIDSPTFKEDFDQYQIELQQSIEELFNKSHSKKIVHIGGGHDHIYPYLCALEKRCKKVVVFNIDAHLDTRTDDIHHSGTPFRQFADNCQVDFKLVQLGIHDFANPSSNFAPLAKGKMHIHSYTDLKKQTDNFRQIAQVLSQYHYNGPETEYVLSLDCDAITAHEMSGVSAVNHQGLSLDFVHALLEAFVKIPSAKHHFGIYEYNPLYDDLSQKGARALASLMYRFFYK